MNTELITQVSAFLWQEADMLDHGEYAQWLESWTNDGLYILPINPLETDFENTLNYACDNAAMRAKRVARLGARTDSHAIGKAAATAARAPVAA